jgi:hypothetical protein
MKALRENQTMSPERLSNDERDPRLLPILEQYGHVLVLNHKDQPQPLAQAVEDCPPFADALLSAESPEQLQQLIDSQKVPEQR